MWPIVHVKTSHGGQSEPAVTNASVGHYVPWMGYVFSLGGRWGPFFFSAGLCFFIRRQVGSISFRCWSLYYYYYFFCSSSFFSWSDITHNYHIYLLTLVSTAPPWVAYLLSLADIITLTTSYVLDLVTVLSTYPTNLATLLIIYPTNLTTILTMYLTNLSTFHTRPRYWHKYFTNLITL